MVRAGINFLFLSEFLLQTLTIHRTAGERRGSFFIPFYHFPRSRTFRSLFATLHVRRLLRIVNRNACVCQAATRWDLPPYWITIWLINWWCSVCCLPDDWIPGFCYISLVPETGGFELALTITLYHPCITREPTKKVC